MGWTLVQAQLTSSYQVGVPSQLYYSPEYTQLQTTTGHVRSSVFLWDGRCFSSVPVSTNCRLQLHDHISTTSPVAAGANCVPYVPHVDCTCTCSGQSAVSPSASTPFYCTCRAGVSAH
jgi:hypothetical protein